MNGAIVAKTLRDLAGLLLLMTLAIIGFELVLVRALGALPMETVSSWMQLPLVSRILKALLGAEPSAMITATGLVTIGFSHPVLYTLTWSFLLTVCTRVIVGEIDRGTADLLLTLPVGRASVYASVSIVWILAGVPLSLAPLAGVCMAQQLFPLWEPVHLSRLPGLCVNLFALYLAIGCFAMLVSSFTSRRGTAIAIALSVLVASFLLDFVVALWPAAQRVALLGLLNYYEPLPYVRTGRMPFGHLAVLTGAATLTWLTGLVQFSRRDIHAP